MALDTEKNLSNISNEDFSKLIDSTFNNKLEASLLLDFNKPISLDIIFFSLRRDSCLVINPFLFEYSFSNLDCSRLKPFLAKFFLTCSKLAFI